MIFASIQYARWKKNKKQKKTKKKNNNNNNKKQNKNISDLKKVNLKKDAVSSIYPRYLTYRSYLSVTEKFNTIWRFIPTSLYFQN